jgi:hypothetical protein
MAASAHAFTTGAINVIQTLLGKPDPSGHVDIPPTRDDIYTNEKLTASRVA